VEVDADDIDAQLWEIAENLHRAELSALERNDHIARWIELSEQKVSSQVATKSADRPSLALTRTLRTER